MAWVTWRQHRAHLFGGLGLLALLAATAVGTHVPILTEYHAKPLADCLPPGGRSGCDLIVRHFEGEFGSWVSGIRGLMVLPALFGLFVGAPLLARELELGTHRFAWTQGVPRSRWLVSKTAWIALATVLVAAAVSGLVMWWRGPFDTLQGRMSPSAFDLEGLVVPAYALFALALGVLAGLVFRRTVPAMTATLIAFAATRLIVLKFARPHFLAPLQQVVAGTDVQPAGNWVLSDTLVDAGGSVITTARENLAVVHAQQAGIDPQSYILGLGWKRIVSYQPADRFWTFQAIEAGIFAALAVAVVLLTLWLVRRRPA
ncbi:MAG: ABC transporter permease subunit [Actinobacteria bacterium]|nr:ABC transporter permease subunit [Actinomycetota bacterium]